MGAQRDGFHLLVKQSVIDSIKGHGRSSMHAEVCGVLVGEVLWDSWPFLYIEACIEGKGASDNVASVTFTSETWDYIHEELSSKYPDRKIVGWYHTHPGFGIFLSDMDMFINRNFFNFPWQTAYVYDPQAEQSGFFIWKDSLMKPTIAEVLEDKLIIPLIPAQIPEVKTDIVNEKISPAIDINKKMRRETFNNTIIAIAMIASLFALALSIYIWKKSPVLNREVKHTDRDKLNQLENVSNDDTMKRQSRDGNILKQTQPHGNNSTVSGKTANDKLSNPMPPPKTGNSKQKKIMERVPNEG
jgi:proteasome lid subunit RPN8/RPN11